MNSSTFTVQRALHDLIMVLPMFRVGVEPVECQEHYEGRHGAGRLRSG
jgi:hypothetical protein